MQKQPKAKVKEAEKSGELGADGSLALPGAWQLVDSLREEIDLYGCKVTIAGFAAKDGEEGPLATGSAASWTQDPRPLAGYELFERMAILEALAKPETHSWRLIDPQRGGSRGEVQGIFTSSPEPELWRAARSNGVAIGNSWQQASQHALAEAVERHLVLASWYGASRPERVRSEGEAGLPFSLQALARHFRLEHFSFGSLNTAGSKSPIFVSGSFLWPLKAEAPLVYGFGGGSSPAEALQKSLKEAVQRLCFLDGAETPESKPAFEPTADFHQNYFLHPSRKQLLRRWLDGDFYRPGDEVLSQLLGGRRSVQFVDLTPAHLEQLFVVKVLSPHLLPLCFGRYRPASCPDLPEDRLIHPIV